MSKTLGRYHNYFMKVAQETATLSKDPKTKVGAIIVKNRRIKSVGFNGAPSSFPDELIPLNDGERLIDKKNTFMCHAELNAILNYDNESSGLHDGIIYTTISPCSNCAKMLAQIGIKEVVYLEEYHRSEETEAAKYIFNVCGVKYTKFAPYTEEFFKS